MVEYRTGHISVKACDVWTPGIPENIWVPDMHAEAQRLIRKMKQAGQIFTVGQVVDAMGLTMSRVLRRPQLEQPPIPPVTLPAGGVHILRAQRNGGETSLSQVSISEFGCNRDDDAQTVMTNGGDANGHKVLMYKSASDMRDVGIGTAIPPQSTRFATDSGITRNEALAHDVANPSDKWSLTTNGSSPATPWFGFAGIYGGHVGKVSFQNQWAARTLEQLAAQPMWGGVFVDNITVFRPLSSGWPFELPSEAAWTAAMLAFVASALKQVRDAGYVVVCNANNFIGGDPQSDTGERMLNWWDDVAGTDGVDGLFVEAGIQNANNRTLVRLEGTAGNVTHYWQNWVQLIPTAQAHGCWGMQNCRSPSDGSIPPESSQMRYCRAGALLHWNGIGVCFANDSGMDSFNPVQGVNVRDLAEPVGAAGGIADNGCYKREYRSSIGAEMWVAINPSGSSKQITVGDTLRTIPSADAYLGGP